MTHADARIVNPFRPRSVGFGLPGCSEHRWQLVGRLTTDVVNAVTDVLPIQP